MQPRSTSGSQSVSGTSTDQRSAKSKSKQSLCLIKIRRNASNCSDRGIRSSPYILVNSKAVNSSTRPRFVILSIIKCYVSRLTGISATLTANHQFCLCRERKACNTRRDNPSGARSPPLKLKCLASRMWRRREGAPSSNAPLRPTPRRRTSVRS